MRSALGIDIGGTNLRVARVAADGRIEERWSEAVTRDPDAVIARLNELCRELDDSTVDAIGIGVPGRVDSRRREVLSGGYVDLAGHDLARRVETALGKAVVIDNDCSMALMAEMALGAAQGFRNVIMFTIGTGIGGAVALDGRIAMGPPRPASWAISPSSPTGSAVTAVDAAASRRRVLAPRLAAT